MDAPRWPLSRDRQELVVMLAEMIRRFGREHFLAAPVARADKRDFPDPWDHTLHAVHQTLYRLCWLAHIDPEIVVEDLRPPNRPDTILVRSEMEIASCAAGVVTFHVGQIGNDDVAGLLSHKIGQAFLELAPGEPFRTAKHESDEVEGSVAAIYLCLGVLAANSSMYRRHRAVVRGRSEYSEQEIAKDGGLEIAEATMLLAIQDLLRDDVVDLDTLHKPQREWVEQWKDILDPHEDELRSMLGLDEDADPQPLSRRDAPRTAPPRDEKEHRRFNAGHHTMRVRYVSWAPIVFGILVGTSGFIRGPIVGIATMVLFGTLGWMKGKPYYRCSAPGCRRILAAKDTTCPSCGGAITKTLTPKSLEEYYRQLRAEEDARDELIDPSEFAGDPDEPVASERQPARVITRARTRHARS